MRGAGEPRGALPLPSRRAPAARRYRERALALVREAAPRRAAVSGEDHPSHVLLLLHEVGLLWAAGDVAAALPVQARVARLLRGRDGDAEQGAVDWSRALGTLAELHLLLGDTRLREATASAVAGEQGKWTVDTAESWHWDAAAAVTRRVRGAARRAAEAAGSTLQRLEEEGRRATETAAGRSAGDDGAGGADLHRAREGGSLQARVRAAIEAAAAPSEGGSTAILRVGRATAQKMRRPEATVVSMDTQPWPNRAAHTAGS